MGTSLILLILGVAILLVGLGSSVVALLQHKPRRLLLSLGLCVLGLVITTVGYRLWYVASHEPVAFMNAIEQGQSDRVNDMLTRHPGLAQIDPSPWGYAQPPLHQAVMSGKAAILKRLLKENPPLEKTDAAGDTALLLAVRLNYPQAAHLLLAHGADPNARDAQGLSARQLASRQPGNIAHLFTPSPEKP